MLALAQRLRPPALDVLLALALLAVVEAEVVSEHLHPYRASVPTFAVSMGVLAWRRRLPFAAILVGFAAGLIAAAAGVSQHKPFSPIFGVFVGLYSLALYASPRSDASRDFSMPLLPIRKSGSSSSGSPVSSFSETAAT